MQFGVTIHATDVSMDAVELAVAAEERGYASFLVPEHTHIPTSRRSPAPTGTPELGEEYLRSPDPYITLAAAAAVTSTIRLGTGIGLPLQHDPITFAKEIATLDRISSGRFVFGIGFGWNHEEMENHGVDPKSRRARCREHMLLMRELWSKDVASYQGEFVSMEASWQWPKPVQLGGPPILLGGAPGPKLFAQIAEYGAGWLPIGGGGMGKAIPTLREVWEANGRDPAALQIIPFGTHPDPGKLEYYESLGCTEVIFRLPSAPRDEVMPVLDDYTRYL